MKKDELIKVDEINNIIAGLKPYEAINVLCANITKVIASSGKPELHDNIINVVISTIKHGLKEGGYDE